MEVLTVLSKLDNTARYNTLLSYNTIVSVCGGIHLRYFYNYFTAKIITLTSRTQMASLLLDEATASKKDHNMFSLTIILEYKN